MKNVLLYYLKNDTHEIYTNMQEQDLMIGKQTEIQIQLILSHYFRQLRMGGGLLNLEQ